MSWEQNVAQHTFIFQQMMKLENEANVPIARCGSYCRRDCISVDFYRARKGFFEKSQNGKKCTFARSRFSHDGNRGSSFQTQREIFQHMAGWM
jgi:hypothetical protein